MKKLLLLLLMLLLASNNSFAEQAVNGNYTVSYDCGFTSGFGLMEAEYEGVDKIFAPKTTVTIGNIKLVNPSYTIQLSNKDKNNQICTVAGAGEQNEFYWYISKNKCTKIVKQSLSNSQFTECGVEITLKK